jgi:tyramine---L-glutamate ligase
MDEHSMQFFLYEYITGGGTWHAGTVRIAPSLVAEGSAMLAAVIADFGLLASARLSVMRDGRLPRLESADCRVVTIGSAEQEQVVFKQLAAEADWTLLIAPETGGALLERCCTVAAVGGRLLSPSAACVEVASNKQTTAELLMRSGVSAPRGWLLGASGQEDSGSATFPLVAKPVDGCGSQGVRLIRSYEELRLLPADGSLRVEAVVPGIAASVAILCGEAGNHALPACEQRLSSDGRFTYQGGRLPLAPAPAERARRLALAAVAVLPSPRGYVGVDLVLGDATDGSSDCVIEINPRLTTSYAGLRALSRTNLAAAMLAAAQGGTPDLCFSEGPVEFTANGVIL